MLSVLALLMLLVMLLSACGTVFGSTEDAEESALDGVASYVDGVAGSVSNGTVLDWVYETLPGKGLPAESAYKTMSTVSTGTFSASNGYSTTNTFYSLPATNTTYLTLSGCKNPTQNSNQYYRLNYADSATYPGSLNTSTNKGSGVAYLATQTAGVAVRFCTDASMVAVQAVMRNCNTNFNHMSKKGIWGFDVYVGTGTDRTWVTNTNAQMVNDGADGSTMACYLNLPSGYKEVLIMFPQYGGVTSVNIGLPKNAKIAKANDRSAKDVCFYGTSITQGACSNRPGTSYTNTLGRTLDVNVRNLGFSGSGKGEPVMAEYIASMVNEFSAVVLDFERNGTFQELLDWHYNFYATIRKASATVPIILVTRPIFTDMPTVGELNFHSVVMNTYQRAIASGDTHIYMLNGYEYFTPGMADLYTVDNTHPNDLGHYFMANKLYPYLYRALYCNEEGIPTPSIGDYTGYDGKYISHPAGYFAEGAKVANAKWQPGWVEVAKKTDTATYDATTNAYIKKNSTGVVSSMYSYTDMMHFPKAGTKVWYHIPASTYTSSTAHRNDGTKGTIALVAFYDSNGTFIDGESISAWNSTGFNYRTDADGDLYFWETQLVESTADYATTGRWICYITRKDNERIRFSFNLHNQASSPTIYYCEPEGPTFVPTNKDTTKVKVDVNWNINQYMQWDNGLQGIQNLPIITSDVLTIEKAGTTIVWWDDNMADPSIGISSDKLSTVNCDSLRAYGGGIVGVAAFKSDGNGGWTYDPSTLRIAANNQLKYGEWSIIKGGQRLYADSLDGTMRCYAYTTTKDNETIRISYYGGWDYNVTKDATTGEYTDDTSRVYKVRPYDVYMYVPNN